MLPILWIYFLQKYFKRFFICLSSFIAILIVSRFKEIAKFMALSEDVGKTALFALYQIPAILPLAIPCSALVSSALLMQNLTRAQELTAMRVSGFSLKTILTPLIGASLFLSMISFFFCFTVTPYCTQASKDFFFEKTSNNPLVLLQRHHLIKLRNSYCKMKTSKDGMQINDLIFITPSHHSERLVFFTVKTLQTHKDLLRGKFASTLFHTPHQIPGFEPLFLENQRFFSTKASDFSTFLRKRKDKIHPATFNFQTLMLHGKQGNQKAQIEALRRCSLPLAVITFTLLGAAYGMEIGRNISSRKWIIILLLILPVLISFLSLKSFKTNFLIAITSSFIPHLIILMMSTDRLRRIAKGNI